MKLTPTVRLFVCPAILLAAAASYSATKSPLFRVNVDVVQLSFTATDSSGRYVKGLRPEDITVLEDGAPQTVLSLWSTEEDAAPGSQGAIWILMDTSSKMYRYLPQAQDAIADFIRGLPPAYAIAVYSFSRNIHRTVPLTADRDALLRHFRTPCAGAETSIVDSVLLTLRDAETVRGPRRIVVFTSGPDDSSMLSTQDVARAAEETGVAVDIVSPAYLDEDWHSALIALTKPPGGRTTVAMDWRLQRSEFARIGEQLRNSYVVSYRPQRTDNPGFRSVAIKVNKRPGSGDCTVTAARRGYRPAANEADAELSARHVAAP